MSHIKVLRPDVDTARAGHVALAPRGRLPDGARLMLIDNSKPKARDLLELLGEELRSRLPIGHVEVFSKPSAAKPIVEDEAKMMAARAHLVVSGLGD